MTNVTQEPAKKTDESASKTNKGHKKALRRTQEEIAQESVEAYYRSLREINKANDKEIELALRVATSAEEGGNP